MSSKNRELPPPSDEFKKAISNSSSGYIRCGFCDRTHVTGDPKGWDLGKGEYDILLEECKADPDKYILHPDENSIKWGDLNGKQYVVDCPCNSASKYEKLFLKNRHLIARFLKKRAETMKRRSEEEGNLARTIINSIE